MNLIFIGAPGSGKGTQSKLIVEKYNLTHISTGDIFRKAIKEETPAGIEAKKYIEKGCLVPDEVTIKIVEERLQNDDCKKGFIFDGFPRTMAQAVAYDDIATKEQSIDYVIYLEIDDSVLIDRIEGRRICPHCGASYHVKSHPSKVEGICDECGSELITRKDDNKESVAVRLNEFHSLTKPLVDYYKSKGKLVRINALQDINKVFDDIVKSLEK